MKSNDELLLHSKALTAVANQLRLIERMIGMAEDSRIAGDQFSVHHQIQSGLFWDIGICLDEVEKTVQAISNDICPDYPEESAVTVND